METSRVWAEIDLDALEHNLDVLRRRIADTTKVLFVVKADAYGHGAVPIAHHALRTGVDALGVGTAAEALALRQSGIRARILVLGTIVDAEVEACLRHDVELGLHSSDRARSLARAAQRMGVPARVHLNVDTGMGRLGVLPRRAASVLRVVRKSPSLELAGVMTHLSATGAGDPRTDEQLKRFDRVLASARSADLIPASAWIHAANSVAILEGRGIDYDAVRPGIAALGMLPEHPCEDELRPVMSWRTQVIFLKDIPRGARVGYGGEWTATRRTRLATLPVGYSDGLAWSLGNVGSVLVRGRRAPLIGRVSMDYATIDVTDVEDARVGDRVTLIGTDGEETLTVEDVARCIPTIPYEVTCRIGQRVERTFVGGRSRADIEADAPESSRTPAIEQAPPPRRSTAPAG